MSVLCTVLNSSSDKGVVVSLHLGSPPKAVGEASLLDLVMFLSDSEHSSAVGKKRNGSAVDFIAAQRTRQSKAQHTQQRRQRHGGWWKGRRSRGWSFRFGHVTPVLRVHAPLPRGFCVVFRLSQLVTSPYGGTGAFVFLVAWFPSRW